MTDLKVYLDVTTTDGKVIRINKVLRLTSSFALSKMLSNGWNFYRIYNEYVYKCASDGVMLCLRCRKERGNLCLSHVDVYAFNECTGVAYDEDLIFGYNLYIFDTSKRPSVSFWVNKFTPVSKYRSFILV